MKTNVCPEKKGAEGCFVLRDTGRCPAGIGTDVLPDIHCRRNGEVSVYSKSSAKHSYFVSQPGIDFSGKAEGIKK